MKPGSQSTVLEVLKAVEADRLSVKVVDDNGPASVVVALVKNVTVAEPMSAPMRMPLIRPSHTRAERQARGRTS